MNSEMKMKHALIHCDLGAFKRVDDEMFKKVVNHYQRLQQALLVMKDLAPFAQYAQYREIYIRTTVNLKKMNSEYAKRFGLGKTL